MHRILVWMMVGMMAIALLGCGDDKGTEATAPPLTGYYQGTYTPNGGSWWTGGGGGMMELMLVQQSGGKITGTVTFEEDWTRTIVDGSIIANTLSFKLNEDDPDHKEDVFTATVSEDRSLLFEGKCTKPSTPFGVESRLVGTWSAYRASS